MRLYTIALKNIVRRKYKMALVVIGLAVGIATLVSIMTLMTAFQKSIDGQLDAYGFNIVIYPASSNLSLSYGGMNVSGVDTYERKSLSGQDIAKIRRMTGANTIRAISPKILQAVEVGGKTALLVGVDFKSELQVKKWWHLTGTRPSGRHEIVLGADAAKNLKLATGDYLMLAGNRFKVSGVLQETGSQDDGLIFGDLGEVQALYGREGELSIIEVSAKNSGSIDDLVNHLEKTLPGATVSSIKQAVKYKEEAMGSLTRFGLMVTALIIMISGLIVFMMMASSVNDRKREIGIFRAVGYRKSSVARIILIEALFLSVVGGVIGYITGFGAIYVLPTIMRQVNLSVDINVAVLLLAIGLAVTTGLVASFIPAQRAANMDPADALKSL
ncbi:MAG TPA: FtsX-like permease family protein [Anaerolineae bacterium]|jgi:putative ABC transport system permease protein|nr:FtsX-like permease family protein [Anaerolineae bacterium]